MTTRGKDAQGPARDEYRQVRLTINPGRNLTTVALVARRRVGNRNVDHLLYRGNLENRVPYPRFLDIVDLCRQALDQVEQLDAE